MPVDCMVLRPRCSPKAHTLTPGRAAEDDLWKEARAQVRSAGLWDLFALAVFPIVLPERL